jgi:hypothetical protein
MENTKDIILENKKVIEVTNEKVDVKGGIRNLPSHNISPYHEILAHSMDYGSKKVYVGVKDELVSTITGEVHSTQVIYKTEVVDRRKFVKIYVDEMKNLYDLPLHARKVFEYICANLKKDSDEIYIHQEEVMEIYGWKQVNQVHKALIFLTKKGFIARQVRPYWWYINPTIFFNGDSVMFVRKITKNMWEQGTLDIGSGDE